MSKGKKSSKKSQKLSAAGAEGPPQGEEVPPAAETPLPQPSGTPESAPESERAFNAETPSQGTPPDRPEEPKTAERATAREDRTADTFPVVGIGTSAGGLAALEALFAHMPSDSDTGVALVIVQHLDPHHKSILSELVRRYTRMKVFEVTDGMAVEPNCTYIIPPNSDLSLMKGHLHLMEPRTRRGLRLPIDFFFRSLAQDRGDQAIGIILSGNGTDGTLGLRAIKEAGGMAIVQNPTSAEYGGMPRSAIASGMADYVLPTEEIPAQLIAYVKRTSMFRLAPAVPVPQELGAWALKIMALLRAHTGHDFSNYKQNTIWRRLERRMAVNQIEAPEHYVRLLRQNPSELDVLFRELLIGVTSFFRDPGAFDALRDLALPQLMAERPPNSPIRVWVPGCSTGEEAYSIAILIQEASDRMARGYVVQIFATDIDQDAIEKARNGVYPANIAADVSPERLSRFFTHEDKDFFRIKKSLRDQVVFAVQDVIKDPPFSKLDLISCRNMLIYMEPVLQRKLLPLFHYALVPNGFLLLGNSESVGEFSHFFATVDRKWKLYRRKELSGTHAAAFSLPGLPQADEMAHAGAGTVEANRPSLREVTERLLLRQFTPAAATVNEQGDILYVHGRSGKYLELPSGEASLNLVRAAREGLKRELAEGLRRVLTHRQPVQFHSLEVRTNGGFETVDVCIELADGPAGASNLMVVTFRDVPSKPAEEFAPSDLTVPERAAESPDAVEDKDRRIQVLERELRTKSETLQTMIEELETSNEEIKSSNEELQSTNEELQSTNEELETSKEELQSVNEELVTVNAELQQKMEGLSRANNDMNNLLAGTGIGMLFVDHQLHIQRFTPATTQIINLIQSDVGRPVSDLVSNLSGYDGLGDDVKTVLETLIPREAEVQTRDGQWYLMRILPYRTVDNVIEGAVLTFVDIAAQKRAEEELRRLSAQLEHRVNERVAELIEVNQALQRETRQRQDLEDQRSREIDALTHLHESGKEMTQEHAWQKLLQASIHAVLELTRADMAMLHAFDEDSQTYRLTAHRGVPEPLLDQWQTVRQDDASPAAEAIRRRDRVVVDDVVGSPLLSQSPGLAALEAAGVRTLQTTPVFGRNNRVVALLSTHWTQPARLNQGTWRLVDLLARQLADVLEQSTAND